MTPTPWATACRTTLLALGLATAASCASRSNGHGTVPATSAARVAQLDSQIPPILQTHGVLTAGVGVIDAGRLVWTGHYGEQAPGIPASAETLFNVASMAKTVAAETVLRLAARGQLSIDEPMAPWWVDPDLAEDPRHQLLTPRMALTHTTGFPNWRFFTADRVLTFERDPGTGYGYSGEGFEYLARYAEEKLGRDIATLAREVIFDPLGIERASLMVRPESYGHMAQPRTSSGDFPGHYCRPNGWCRKPGDISAADDLVISVEGYARFLISAMHGEGLTPGLARERNRVQTSTAGLRAESVDCADVPPERCPQAQGYGLGWKVLDFGDYQLIGHGGSDWSEVALGYFHTDSRDGLVIFLNAPMPNGLAAMVDLLALLDPDSPMLDEYRRRAAASGETGG